MKANVQHYPGGREEEFARVSASQLVTLLGHLEAETGSTLEVAPDSGEYPRVIVGVDRGRFMAMALISPDEFYDRLGDPTAPGVVELILGGQSVDDVPSRFVLSREQAREALEEFVTANNWPVSNDWIRQGPGGWR
jgi:hypothetical protein